MSHTTCATPLPASSAVIVASARSRRVADFVELTKPGMNFLVLATTAVGFAMAASPADWPRLLPLLLGTALTAAAASVFNQWSERDLDALMKRTASRPLPAGRLAPPEALRFALVMTLLGVAALALLVNQ